MLLGISFINIIYSFQFPQQESNLFVFQRRDFATLAGFLPSCPLQSLEIELESAKDFYFFSTTFRLHFTVVFCPAVTGCI